MFRRSTFKFDFPCGTNWNEFIRNSLIQRVYVTSYRADGVQFLAKERNVSPSTRISRKIYTSNVSILRILSKEKLLNVSKSRTPQSRRNNSNSKPTHDSRGKHRRNEYIMGPIMNFRVVSGKGGWCVGQCTKSCAHIRGRATLGFQLLRSSRGRAESAVIRQGRCNDPEMVIPWKVPERMPNPKVTLNARPSVVAGVDNSTRRIV